MRGLLSAREQVLRLCLLQFFFVALTASPAAAAAPGVGSHAPPLALADIGGVTRNVTWGEGTPATIVFFFDPQSSECLLEMSFLDALYRKARDFGLAVYAVEVRGRQPAEVKLSLERYSAIYRGPSFPVLPDPAFRTGRVYGAENAPITFVMESHGLILNRIGGYDHTKAVVVVRRLEQLLRLSRGMFAGVLRDVGVTEAEEREAENQLLAAESRPGEPARALDTGDLAPELEFVDRTGRAGRWSWQGGTTKGPRILAFFRGLTVASIEELAWLDSLARRGARSGLEVLAVETGGMNAAELEAAIEKYRRFHPDPIFPVVVDPEGRLARAFGPWEQMPQTYLLAADGTIIAHAAGFGVGDAVIITDKTERAYSLLGRPFPTAGSTVATGAPQQIEGEAPSIRAEQKRDNSYGSDIEQADAAFAAWEFDRALAHYLAALEAHPNDLQALERVARIYGRRGDVASALAFWDLVLALQPDYPEAADHARELRDSPEGRAGSD